MESKEYINKWYIIHTYSGYEKKVKTDLEKRIISEELTDKVFRIMVPEETVFEEKRGKMVPVLRKIFPSYVMVEMKSFRDEFDNSVSYRVDSKAWYVIRNTNGVTGFVGVGSDPLPMSDEEVEYIFNKINNNEEIIEVKFKVGDFVKTHDSIEGEVDEIDLINKQVKLLVNIGNRLTPMTFSINDIILD